MSFSASSVTRRQVVGLAGAGACALAATAAAASPATAHAEDAEVFVPSFLAKPDPLPEPAETKDYDVVVVGCGASGLAAAFKAHTDGAKVAIVQKLSFASSQGFEASGLATENDESAKQAFASMCMRLSAYRPKRELLDVWAHTSGEAILFFADVMDAAGVEHKDVVESGYERDCNGYMAKFIKLGPAPTYAGSVGAIADYAQTQGIDVFYDTPGVYLVTDGGAVTGVVAGTEEGGYTQFNAARGVILSTGDYQCNEDMIAYYCPDVRGFPPLEVGRTGDGHRMGVWAGGRIEPVGHTKMIHDVWMNSAPYLMVGPDGKRFADEHMPWWEINTLMRNLMQHAASPDDGRIFSIMDDDYYQQAQAWQQVDPSLSAKELIPDTVETMGENGSFALVHHGETVAELAEAMGVDAAALEATVERYNELVDLGSDEDFGKEAALLAPIAKPPFHAVQRDFNWGLSATLGGLVVDGDNRVLNIDDEPIAGLFATGNTSGPFFGGVDYPMNFPGLSIGRALTTGFIAGRAAAARA